MQFIIIILLSNISASIVGEYRLTGLNVVDYDFCRQSTDIKVIEKSGFSLDSLIVYTIPQGKNIDYDVRDPYPLFALNAAGVDLWVYFAEDGTATILEGSTYPTENAGDGCLGIGPPPIQRSHPLLHKVVSLIFTPFTTYPFAISKYTCMTVNQ